MSQPKVMYRFFPDDEWPCTYSAKAIKLFSFHSDLIVCLGSAGFPLISLFKYSSQIVGVHHMLEKSECGRHIRHRKETRGLSVGSNGVDMRKIPGMLKKHSFTGLKTEEEGNKNT